MDFKIGIEMREEYKRLETARGIKVHEGFYAGKARGECGIQL